MRFIRILIIAMLVWAPVMANSVAHAGEGRTVAAEKSKKGKKAKAGKSKGKAGKAKSGKADAKAKGAKGKKGAAKAAVKGKAKKSKKVAAKRPRSHAPAEHLDSVEDPSGNFEVSPEMQDDLPAPNNGSLTD